MVLWDSFLMKKLLKKRFVSSMTEKLLKNWLKGAEKVAEVCTVYTILSQQSWHKEKKGWNA